MSQNFLESTLKYQFLSGTPREADFIDNAFAFLSCSQVILGYTGHSTESEVTWPRACYLPPEQVTKTGVYLTHLRQEANKLKINGRGDWNAEVILVFANNETGFTEQLLSYVPSTVLGEEAFYITHYL